MLQDNGVNVNKIMPNPESDTDFFLALDIFDSTEFEERTLTEWEELMPLSCTIYMVRVCSQLLNVTRYTHRPTNLVNLIFQKFDKFHLKQLCKRDYSSQNKFISSPATFSTDITHPIW